MTDTYLRNNVGTDLNRHSYLVNNAHQRYKQTRKDNDYVDYLYDDAGQLYSAKSYDSLGVEIPAQRYGYSYDPAWNLAKRTNNATVYTATLNNLNQVTAFAGATYTYDNNGNRSTRLDNGTARYTYDDENQLTVWDKDPATYSGAPRTEMVYDGKMRLRKRTESQWNGSYWGRAERDALPL